MTLKGISWTKTETLIVTKFTPYQCENHWQCFSGQHITEFEGQSPPDWFEYFLSTCDFFLLQRQFNKTFSTEGLWLWHIALISSCQKVKVMWISQGLVANSNSVCQDIYSHGAAINDLNMVSLTGFSASWRNWAVSQSFVVQIKIAWVILLHL